MGEFESLFNVGLAALAALAALIYVPTLRFPFIFDDFPAIVNNVALRSGNMSELWHYVPTRIIGFLSFALNLDLFGPAPLSGALPLAPRQRFKHALAHPGLGTNKIITDTSPLSPRWRGG